MSLDDYNGSLPVRHNGIPMPRRDEGKQQVRCSSEHVTPAYSPLLEYPPFGIKHRALQMIARKLRVTEQKVYEALLAAEEVQSGSGK